ncbi:MAG: D-aminoacyl-tRNA deacylase [Bacteroidia bacterium]|jgi:D-tyrosyl-tRNA(Tyr) deacylase|nr:D-aminoacyl-tRNA deacylase [Bacteroidia bacterium]
MRLLIQRVSHARVNVLGKEKAAIGKGLLVFIGIEEQDTAEDIHYLSSKLVNLRIFEDENEKMNLSVKDVQGQLLLVSQFTLHASTKKGNRPSFMAAAKPEKAEWLYNQFISACEAGLAKPVFCGEFGANMQIELVNNGPVTIFMDSRNKE